MHTRLLSIAIVGVFSTCVQAQLPSDRYSPINFIGRFAGFGYSDGYHACKDEQCKKVGFTKPWESMSTTYGVATAPPTRPVLSRPVTTMPQYTQAYHTHQPVMVHQEPIAMQSPMPVQTFQPPAQQPPAQPLWLNPNNTPSQVLSETVQPAPLMLSPQPQSSQSSPSDLQKPAPLPTIQSTPQDRSEPLPPPPMVPSTRVPASTRSLVAPQSR